MAVKKGTNDQDKIIEAIKKGDYKYAWDHVKYIGINSEKNMNRRYLIFKKAFNDFDAKRNNNFILFYKNYLRYFKFLDPRATLFTTKYQTIIKLNEEKISPTGKNKRIKNLSKWEA